MNVIETKLVTRSEQALVHTRCLVGSALIDAEISVPVIRPPTAPIDASRLK